MIRPIDTCRLCGNVRPLCYSHVVPEFCYSRLYEPDKHQAAQASRDGTGPRRIQKGYREYLLCEDCERHLNTTCEAYFQRIWYTEKQLPDRPNRARVELASLDHKRFRLFHLSVLWRASVARKTELFRRGQLSPRHEERVREMLLAGDPGLYDGYAFVGRCLTHEGEVFHAVSDVQRVRYNEAIAVHVFMYAGCVWEFYICSFEPPEVAHLTLKRDGTMVIPVYDAVEYFALARRRLFKGFHTKRRSPQARGDS